MAGICKECTSPFLPVVSRYKYDHDDGKPMETFKREMHQHDQSENV